ncbi:unnamed protein product, partial [Polarella glacialis]
APKAKAAVAQKAAKASPQLRWLASQLGELEAQRDSGPPWLIDPHGWHIAQLQELQRHLESGTLTDLPQELREGVEFYASQFAGGQSASEGEFYDDREMYQEVLKSLRAEAASEGPYQRAASSEEALSAVALLQAWSETTPQGIGKLQKLLTAHEASAEVQEVGITRLGGLLAELKGEKPGASTQGLAAALLFPIVVAGMARFPRDAGVQRVGCSVMRGLVVADGGLSVVADNHGAALAVKAMRAHIEDVDVCKMGAAVFYAMIQRTEPSSPERMAVRSAEAGPVLSEALRYHPTETFLDRAVRVTLPELRD